MIFKKLDNTDKLLVVETSAKDKRVLKRLKSDKYFSAEPKEKSKFGFYRLVDSQVIVDIAEEQAREAEELELIFEKNIKHMLEDKARELGFDSFHNIGAYLTDKPNPMKDNADLLGAWGGQLWGAAYKVKMEVKAKKRESPKSWEELKSMLPPFEGV